MVNTTTGGDFWQMQRLKYNFRIWYNFYRLVKGGIGHDWHGNH
jgi:hypothetical protein